MNVDHPLFESIFDEMPGRETKVTIDLPYIFEYYIIKSVVQSGQQRLLTLQNGNIFASATAVGKGSVYLIACPMNDKYTNFPRHGLFVPTFFNMAILSEPMQKLYYRMDGEEAIKIRKKITNPEHVYKIKDDTESFEFIPEHRQSSYHTDLFVHNQIKKAGNYYVSFGNDIISAVSFNYDRRESDMNFVLPAEIQKMIPEGILNVMVLLEGNSRELSEIIEELNQGIKLWKLFIIMALIFLLAEVILLRFWK